MAEASKMDLTVAIINYNTRDHLRRCLDTMPEQVRGEPLKVVVIDNASPDNSAAMVATQYRSRVELVANRANVGFARAANQALARSTTRYLLVLNADIEVTEEALEALYDFMEDTPEAGLAGARLVDAEGNLQYSCRSFYTAQAILWRRTPLGKLMPNHRCLRDHLMLDWDHEDERTVDWLQGACLMMRREAMEQIGGMDERFFLYFEDVDLARRMAEAGWGVHYVPQAEMTHHYRRGSHGGLLSREKLHHIASGVRYLTKWSSWARTLGRFIGGGGLVLLLLLDLVLINGGFVSCLVAREQLPGPRPASMIKLSNFYPFLGVVSVALVAAFFSTGLYRPERSQDWLGTTAQTVKAVTWVALAGSVLLLLVPTYRSGVVASRLLLILYYFFLILSVCLSRLAIKGVLRSLWRQHVMLRRIVVVGEADPTRLMADAIRAEPITGYEVADVLPMPEGNGEDIDKALVDEFKERLSSLQPGGVVFVAHRLSFRSYVPLVLESLERNLEVRVATSLDLFPYMAERSGEICGQPAADVTRTPMYGVKCLAKRVTDVLCSTVGLVLTLPVLVFFGVLIKLHDRGPAFFFQDRMGKGGRRFKIIKLRTMAVDAVVDQEANEAEGPLTHVPNDPRVTPIGRWLRFHKIDELPQLLNVLLGHMSMVGPRPPIEEEVREYSEWQKGRLFVRPGLTGLWQIDKKRKWRFNEMVELDLQYILNWSLMLDYSVMIRTVQVVLRGS